MTGIKICVSILTVCLSIANDITAAAEHVTEFSSRLRYSDLDDGDTSGKGTSALFRVSVDSSWAASFSTFAQLDHVETGYQNQHSDGVQFNGQPIVTDVAGTEINQLFAKLLLDRWDFRVGRQVMAFDNQRFVGSISFWQNEQSFDAFFLEKKILSASKINYAYIVNANRIFGDDAGHNLVSSDVNFVELNGVRPSDALGDHKQNSHLLRAEFNEWDYSRLVAYAYLVNNKDAPATSGDTLGARYRLKIKPSEFQYRLELESAIQKRTELVTTPILSYFMVDAGIGLSSVELSVSWEQMDSKDDVAFFAPLGTMHDFNGWADQFNTPPDVGLSDLSMKLKWRITPFQFDVRVHRFEGEEGGEKFGQEVDFDIIYKPLKKHVFMLRFADFKASADTDAFEDKRQIFFNYSYNL